jgi:hypothetical protein
MALTHFVLYDATGRIVGDGLTQLNNVATQTTATLTALASTTGTPDTHYVNGGAVVARPTLDAVATVTGAVGWHSNGTTVYSYGTALPNPTKVTVRANGGVNGKFKDIAPFNVTDGTLNLTTTLIGDYVITLEAFPYLTKTLSVTSVT